MNEVNNAYSTNTPPPPPPTNGQNGTSVDAAQKNSGPTIDPVSQSDATMVLNTDGTATINLPTLVEPITLQTGLTVTETAIIDLSIIYQTMQSITDSQTESILSNNEQRKNAFEEYLNKLDEVAEQNSDKCGGSPLLQKIFTAVTIIASAISVAATFGATGPLAIAAFMASTAALSFEVTDAIYEGVTGESLMGKGIEALANKLEEAGMGETAAMILSTVIMVTVLLVASVAGSVANMGSKGAKLAGEAVEGAEDATKLTIKASKNASDDVSSTITKHGDQIKDGDFTGLQDDIVKGFGDDIPADEAQKYADDFVKNLKNADETNPPNYPKKAKGGSAGAGLDDVGGAGQSATKLSKRLDTEEKLQELFNELKKLLAKKGDNGADGAQAAKGASKTTQAGEAAADAATEGQALLPFMEKLLGTAGVKQLTFAGALLDGGASIGQGIVGIKQGVKTIRVAKIQSEVIDLKTIMDVLDKRLEQKVSDVETLLEAGVKANRTILDIIEAKGNAAKQVFER